MFNHGVAAPKRGGVDGIAGINIIAYEPAFGIIGDPAKKDPKTRQPETQRSSNTVDTERLFEPQQELH